MRVKVPEEGFGRQLDEMYTWLDREIGRGKYDESSDTQPGHDAVSFYFADPQSALNFFSAFRLVLCDLRE